MVKTDESLLLAACVANYDEDDVRLRYADWLQEQPSMRVNCLRCKGKGHYSFNGAEFGYTVEDCEDCDKTGSRIDTSNADRAELIRIQIERVHSGNALHGAEITSAILNRHPEWSQVKCPMLDHGPTVLCSVCRSTANLLAWWGERDTNLGIPIPDIQPRPIHWSRGFIEVVEARSEEVWESRRIPCPACTGICDPSVCESCEGSGLTEDERTVPTPWVRAIVEAIPTLREIRLTDREPYHVNWPATGYASASNFWRWWCYRNEPEAPPEHHTSLLPEAVYELLRKQHPFPTREAAVTALGRSVCDWARSHLTAGPASPPSPRDPASP